MDALDKFFKKFSYKFPKGYPDMKNEQDILLLESLVNKILGEEIVLEKKLEWKDLSDESRKYYRLEVIADKIANKEPFKLENGKEEILKFNNTSYADLFKSQKVNDIRNTGGKNINKFPFFDKISVIINKCCICYETNSNIITECTHQFCYDCLSTWYDKSKKCPFCRYQFTFCNIIQ